MSEALAALVVLPISAAVLSPLLGAVRRQSGWWVALGALAGQAALAAYATALVVSRGRVSYAVGGFAAPVGVELVLDGLSAPFVCLVALVALGLLAYTRVGGPRSNAFYGLYLLLVAGLSGVCVTGDAFTLYVFLEISGLAAYAMVARAPGGRAALAALKYLLLGTVGATLYLLGVGYAYAATGTLNMADLAARLPHDSTLTLAAFAFVSVGLAVKLALYPLHVWQPDAYEHAPPAVSALLAALVSTVAGYALLRLVFGVFTVRFFAARPLADEAILLLSGVSVLAGGALAYRQASVKRMFAYSSVAQFGLAALGVGLGTVPAVVGAVVQLLGHAVTKGGLFAAAGVVAAGTDGSARADGSAREDGRVRADGGRTAGEASAGSERSHGGTIEDYAGLGGRRPWTGGSLAVLGLGMVGLPPTVGFVAKWYLAVGAVEAGAWPVLAVVLASTLLSLAYFGRLVQAIYADDARPGADARPAGEVAQEAGARPEGGVAQGADGPQGASPGMTGVAVAAAVATVALGFAAVAVAALVEPTVAGLLAP